MPKLAYFPWYPAEAAADGWWRSLSLSEKGLHLELLSIAWPDGGLEKDLDVLARSVGITRVEFDILWKRVCRKWIWNGEFLVNNRQEKERGKIKKISDAAASSANRRWDKERNAVAYANASEPHCNGNARASDSDSDYKSSSDSSSEEKKDKPRTLIPNESQFHEWWNLWSKERGTAHHNAATQTYLSLVDRSKHEALMACTRSYLAHAEPSKGFRPDNFLTEQAREDFSGTWAPRAGPVKSANDLRREKALKFLEEAG